MTDIKLFKSDDYYKGFEVTGHSGYEDKGKDIVCAGISALVINFANSIEEFTDDKFEIKLNEDGPLFYFKFEDEPSSESKLLIDSLVIGLKNIQNDYEKFISLEIEEV